MEIGGLPLHFLVIHAAVVFTPLAALAAIVFAVVPRWRWLSRWPTALLALVSFGSVWIARLSGEAFLAQRPELGPLVRIHESRGDLLSYVMIGFLLLALGGAWALGGTTGLASGRGARTSTLPAADKVISVVLVLISIAVLVLVILTGDAGSRAVWG